MCKQIYKYTCTHIFINMYIYISDKNGEILRNSNSKI